MDKHGAALAQRHTTVVLHIFPTYVQIEMKTHIAYTVAQLSVSYIKLSSRISAFVSLNIVH